MTGEYRDDKKPHHPTTTTTTTMFSKFHHHQPQQTPPPRSQHFAIAGHQFQLSNTAEEADSRSRSRSPTHTITRTPIEKDVTITANDGASIEVVRRPRGRPPGSKNKPKPPVFITREPDTFMSPYVLELPGGTDIVEAINLYCRKRNMGLCVLTGSGTVTNVSLRQPTTTPDAGATVTFHGRFDILSISATVLPSLSLSSSSSVATFVKGFTISLAGPQGQIVGGAVAGPLMSARPVYIIAASINNPLYHRLPLEEEDIVRNSDGGSASPPTGYVGEENGGHHLPTTTAADAMSMYSSHLPLDVIWAPTPRQASPHQPPF